jgi:hypothetical protein
MVAKMRPPNVPSAVVPDLHAMRFSFPEQVATKFAYP